MIHPFYFLSFLVVVVGFHRRRQTFFMTNGGGSSKKRTVSTSPMRSVQKDMAPRRQWIPNSNKTPLPSRVIMTNPLRINQTLERRPSNATRNFEYDLRKPLVYITSHNINELTIVYRYRDKACLVKGDSFPTSIIQIAVRQRPNQNESVDESVIIIDLLDIKKGGKMMALDKILKPVMSDNTILKFGQELEWDLKDLSKSYTELSAFRTVHNIL